MSIEVKIGPSTYQISCHENEAARLKQLAEGLNEKVNALAPHFDDGDEKKLLVLASLLIQEELQEALKSEKNQKNAAPDSADNLNEDEIYDAVSETMENVSDYIKKFTNRIQNY